MYSVLNIHNIEQTLFYSCFSTFIEIYFKMSSLLINANNRYGKMFNFTLDHKINSLLSDF